MTTIPTTSPIKGLCVVDTLNVGNVKGIVDQFTNIAKEKLGCEINKRTAMCIKQVPSDYELIRKEARYQLVRLRNYSPCAVIIVGDFSPAVWDALVAEFPDVEMCNITSEDLAA